MKTSRTTAEKLLLSFDKQLVKLLKSDLNILKTLHSSPRTRRTMAA